MVVDVLDGFAFDRVLVVDGNSTDEPVAGSPAIQVGSRYVLFLFSSGGSSLCLTLYPQLYSNMIIDANGVLLNEFVSQIKAKVWLTSWPQTLLPVAILLPFAGLLSQYRKRQWPKIVRMLGIGAACVSALAYALLLLSMTSPVVLQATTFWVGFLSFAAGLFLLGSYASLHGKQSNVGRNRFLTVLASLTGVYPLVLIIAVLSQTGATMFEKNFEAVALIDGTLLGTLPGFIAGGSFSQWRRTRSSRSKTTDDRTLSEGTHSRRSVIGSGVI